MKQYISKSALVAEINKRIIDAPINNIGHQRVWAYNDVKDIIGTLDVKDPYEQCVQYDSIKAGIQAHAETYSFNIESELFNQLTKEQQKLWRKEIEQAVISGGEMGVELARDMRYKENLEVKEVDLEKEIDNFWDKNYRKVECGVKDIKLIGEHFFELGLKAQHSELTWEDISVLRKIMAEYRRQTSNEMLVLNDEDYCKEVLNRFKAQKGE